MAKTTTISASTTAAPITVQSVCQTIEVLEDAGGATAWMLGGEAAGTFVNLAGGQSYVFRKPSGHFHPNEIAGYIKLASGTATFAQVEY